MAEPVESTPAPKEEKAKKEVSFEVEEDESEASEDMDIDDLEMSPMMEDDEDELAETLQNIFVTEEGETMATISQAASDHLGNISKLLSNQNKILIKILQNLA